MTTPPPVLDPDAVARALPAAGRVVVVARTGSTSTDLVAAARAEPAAWPDRSVLVADHQAGGRGRAGRTWTTPPRAALTVSVLLRADVPADRLGWLPLLAGLAVVRAVGEAAGTRAALKWPNDVIVPAPDGTEQPGWRGWRKLAGVLCEVVPDAGPPPGAAPRYDVVVGVGINVAQSTAELPVPTAASLRTLGAQVDRTDLLASLVRHLTELDERWRAGDPGLPDEVARACVTLGTPVRVELPGGGTVEGTATALGPDGALVVEDAAGRSRDVHAGDVQHLRAR
ncbi:biotin--[acetyl-CoA-carboxylase] ligase [Actinotalea sp. JY-7876]|uniref:biotin--[acetyl-CoA-carboxylase] ligase n=2 Tax=unclassified Actinotalea TaxID=2638618 RepID=UPI0015F3F95A|nr:biotin--[acetyl-CoA-carboxylase] ligase [Actinotalea sp. JY-7876]